MTARAALLSMAATLLLSAVTAVNVESDVAEDAAALMNMKKAEQPVLYQAIGRKSLKCWQCAVTMGEREGWNLMHCWSNRILRWKLKISYVPF